MTPEQAFVYARPSFVAEEVLVKGRHFGIQLQDGQRWSVQLSMNVGLE